MRPPTPPDDKNQQPGYSTPPNASTPLTPDMTPRKMAAISSPAPVKMLAEAPYADIWKPITPNSDHDRRQHEEDHAVVESAHIPAEKMDTTRHMQGNVSPGSLEHSPSSQKQQQIRVHKKRRQLPARHPEQATSKSAMSTDASWQQDSANDKLYQQLRHTKMDRIEAIEDGSAIEAVIVRAETPRIPSLRHVKKRHSLRLGSASSQPTSDGSPEPQKVAPLVDELPDGRRVSSLRHKKGLDTIRHASLPASSNSGSSIRTLRHERRPLSANGRPQTSSLTTSPFAPEHDTRRHVSLPLHLKAAQNSDMQRTLRRVSKGSSLEPATPPIAKNIGNQHDMSPSLGPPALSPSIKNHRFANTQTPMSGYSDRTEMELCEAKNVTLFAHSNDSILLINQAAKRPQLQLTHRPIHPLSNTFENPESTSSSSSDSLSRSLSTPEIQINGQVRGDESPLTNPRTAPLPPAINFIPPTPSVEDERQQREHADQVCAQPELQRGGSLLRTARRLSDTILTPLLLRSNSQRRVISRPQHIESATNDRLHPMWTPNYMWHDDEYTDDEDDYECDDHDRLPAGGDTSDHPTQRTRSLFPRKMSVRMPGFRGNGGFLQGNSLGVERHGTNRRRPHVEVPSKQRHSTRLPFLESVRERVKGFKTAREDAAREKKRAELKHSIVHNI